MRTILIGDVHGCLDELRILVERVKLSVDDRLIFLGDLVDRGPYSIETVRYVRDVLKAECVLGNHEEKWIRWHGHDEKSKKDPNYINPIKFSDEKKAELAKVLPEDWEWMKNLPTFIRFKVKDRDFIATHAGIPTDKPIENQYYKTLIRVRYVRSDGSYISSPRGIAQPEGSVPWYQMWDKHGKETVIFGHNVVKYPLWTKNTIGIDTGCVFGGRLTGLIIDGDGSYLSYLVQHVPAKKSYWQLPDDDVVSKTLKAK